MSRPLRIEFPGAVYHVTSRGDRREPIYRDDIDRHTQLAVLAEASARFDAHVLAYCLMGNHYHLVLCTRSGALSRLMRQLNGAGLGATGSGLSYCIARRRERPDPQRTHNAPQGVEASAYIKPAAVGNAVVGAVKSMLGEAKESVQRNVVEPASRFFSQGAR